MVLEVSIAGLLDLWQGINIMAGRVWKSKADHLMVAKKQN
jgi:hypothetical protein